jgi:hypothetical protein
VLVNKKNTERLRPEEQEIHAMLFAGSDELTVDDVHYTKFSKARSHLHASVYKQWDTKNVFNTHKLAVGMGGLLLNIVFGLYFWLTGMDPMVAIAFLVASPLICYEIKAMFTTTPNAVGNGCATWFIGGTLAFLAVGTMLAVSDYSEEDIHLPTVFFLSVMSLMYIVYA